MSANTAPIYPLTPNVGLKTLTTADTTKTGTTLTGMWTAGSNGARIRAVECKPIGTNVASVLRVFLNNGSDPTVSTNNVMIEDISLPAITNIETAGQPKLVIPIDRTVPAGWKVMLALGTTVAAGWACTVYGEDF